MLESTDVPPTQDRSSDVTAPPSAASVCPYCPETGEVLMGKRQTPPDTETFCIHCFAFTVASPRPATSSTELHAEWVELDRARQHSPMGPGASRVLAHLAEWAGVDST